MSNHSLHIYGHDLQLLKDTIRFYAEGNQDGGDRAMVVAALLLKLKVSNKYPVREFKDQEAIKAVPLYMAELTNNPEDI